MKNFFSLLLLMSVLSWSGCGYTTSSAVISRYRSIHVEPFSNKIDFTAENRRSFYFPGMETNIREAVVDRFMFDGNLRIAQPDKADLIMQGVLVDYDRGALRYTDNDDVQEYRIQVIADVVLKEPGSEQALWKERVVGEATYFVTGGLATTQSTAVNNAVTDLARRIVERTIQDW